MSRLSIIKRLLGYYNQVKLINTNQKEIVSNFNNIAINKYEHLAYKLTDKQKLQSKEYKIFSQNGEDGILLHIFDQIGMTNRTFIEFGIGNGTQCNTANLSINYNWNGLLLEGNKTEVQKAREYYKISNCQDRVKVHNHFITRENINGILERYGYTGAIDLLSIDIDGNDYWVWEAIYAISPRVVVIEYNGYMDKNDSITIPYDPNFSRYVKHYSGLYFGASAKALNKLAHKKGYTLIGCDSKGVNMFFIKSSALKNKLSKLSISEAYYPNIKSINNSNTLLQLKEIKHMPYVQI